MSYVFVEDEPDLRELFEQLLASAMIKDAQHRVHPGFIEVLRQLTPDEAKILRALSRALPNIAYPLVKFYAADDQSKVEIGSGWEICDENTLTYPDMGPVYLGNLVRLNVLRLEVGPTLANKEPYLKLENSPEGKSFEGATKQLGKRLKIERGIVTLTDFGADFVLACHHRPGVGRPPLHLFADDPGRLDLKERLDP